MTLGYFKLTKLTRAWLLVWNIGNLHFVLLIYYFYVMTLVGVKETDHQETPQRPPYSADCIYPAAFANVLLFWPHMLYCLCKLPGFQIYQVLVIEFPPSAAFSPLDFLGMFTFHFCRTEYRFSGQLFSDQSFINVTCPI